jgi:hypothetical protein
MFQLPDGGGHSYRQRPKRAPVDSRGWPGFAFLAAAPREVHQVYPEIYHSDRKLEAATWP